ncbi:hypothetical protein M514_08324 [Trichuris suis]|uniref:Uncharacterized protein n=1 Tax=Trichuris suis TaxID=68888 RepID=A0A085M0N7_9BILA|nr:hypothetical protein M513_08324 [Trichuris suis]KFD63410.1 hypothetical protein M514_08324 [Trichuris suis]
MNCNGFRLEHKGVLHSIRSVFIDRIIYSTAFRHCSHTLFLADVYVVYESSDTVGIHFMLCSFNVSDSQGGAASLRAAPNRRHLILASPASVGAEKPIGPDIKGTHRRIFM